MSKLALAINQLIINKNDIDTYSIKSYFTSNFPKTYRALQILDEEYTKPKRRKGFNLVLRGNIFYARFSHNGKTLPTKFCTHTGNMVEAEQYAIKNKERLIERYLAKKDGRIYKFLSEFFKNETEIPEAKDISEKCRRDYDNKINKYFIPFLKQERIILYDQVKKTTLIKYQDYVLSGQIINLEGKMKDKPIKPQSVIKYMNPVKKIFEYLTRTGIIDDNVAEIVKRLPVSVNDVKIRGCYEIDKLKGVFNKRWKDERSYILCLIIYITGMRNSEIRKICINDIIKIENCRFIKIKESKTINGQRLVPIHEILYRKLKAWAYKKKKTYLFEDCTHIIFNEANEHLASMLNVSKEQLKKENISFYSGRHFFKTLMNAEGLGEEIEELFMGHKVAGDVKRSYNHRDKQGKERLLKKARQAVSIIDHCIFQNKAARVYPRGRRGSGGASPG